MSMRAVSDAGSARHWRSGQGPIWLLAIGQTAGYGTLYYFFAALLPSLETGFGWSKTLLSLGPTLSIVISALSAPLAGRLIDRGYGGGLLIWGAALGACALAALSLVEGLGTYLVVWAVLGLAHSASLYEVCFSFLTVVQTPSARPAITRVTLVAGFASSLAFPAGALMAGEWGWRGAVLGFAVVQACVTVPVNWLAVRTLQAREAAHVPNEPPHDHGAVSNAKSVLAQALRRVEFWLVAAIFGAMALNHAMIVTYFLPIFDDRGASPAMAVLAASCIGPAQVAGRLVLMLNESRIGTGRAVRISVIWLAMGAPILVAAAAAPGLIFLFALLQGSAMGMSSILRPVLTAEVLGRQAFGAISGVLAMAPTLATACAPFLGAVLIAASGIDGLLAMAFLLALLALGAALILRRRVEMI